MGKALIGNIKLFDINTAACFDQKNQNRVFNIIFISFVCDYKIYLQ